MNVGTCVMGTMRQKANRARLGLLGVLALALIGLATLWGIQNESRRQGATLTVYSGRSEDLIQPLISRFENETGIRVLVRYGQTAEMAATILEEGTRSPADIFLAQDAGALGALAHAGRFIPLDPMLLQRVDPRFRSPTGLWIGLSGRARVVVYNPDRITAEELPSDLFGFCSPKWRARVGWAPANASFQSFVTAYRMMHGHDRAREWLMCMQANDARPYARNTSIVMAVAAGEIDAGLANHYYIHAMQKDRQIPLPVKNHYLESDTLINVSGAGILNTTRNRKEAVQFLAFLLSEPAQQYFTDNTFEYPLNHSVRVNPALPSLSEMPSLFFDLSDLHDLDGTLRLLQDLGIL